MPSRFLIAPIAMCLVANAVPALAQPENLRISQIFVHGGLLANAPNADYVELYNSGDAAVSLFGLSIQASSPQVSWQVIPLYGAIQPRSYLLVRATQPQAMGTPIVPDVVASLPRDALYDYGKVALVEGTTTLTGRPDCPLPTSVIDFVGYGGAIPNSADQRLPCGDAADTFNNAPRAIVTTPGFRVVAFFRRCAGETSTGNNAADFYVADPAPRNSLAAPNTGSAPSGLVRFAATATQAGTSIAVSVDPVVGCDGSIASVTADLTEVGGPSNAPLSPETPTVYSGTLAIPITAQPALYQIPFSLVDSNGRISTIYGTLRVIDPIPNNDRCATDTAAQEPYLLTVDVPAEGDTSSATPTDDGPNPCQMQVRTNAVWYYFVPPESRPYQVTFCNTGVSYPNPNLGFVADIFKTTDCHHFTLMNSCTRDIPCISTRPLTGTQATPLAAGELYAVRITTSRGSGGAFGIMMVAPYLRGETCGNWLSLGPDLTGFGTREGSTAGTAESLDGGPFDCAPSGVTHDFYCVFGFGSSPLPGTVTINTVGSEIDTVIDAQGDLGSGTCRSSVPRIACSDDAGFADDPTASEITIPLQGRTVLRIAQKSPPGSPGGGFRLNFSSSYQPDNDNCLDALAVSLHSPHLTFRANNAAELALDPSVPSLACWPSASRDLFWRFVCDATTTWVASLCDDSPDDYVIQVLDGCGQNARELGCSELQARCEIGGGPRVRFEAESGTTYYVRIASKRDGGGPLRPVIEPVRPLNNVCQGAQPLDLNQPVTVDCTFATATSAVQNYECTSNYYPSASRDVYFAFTPRATAAYTFSTCDLSAFTVMTLHPDCPITYDDVLACSAPPASGVGPCGGTSRGSRISSIVLQADHTYYLRVGTTDSPVFSLLASNDLPLGACRIGSICIRTDPPRCPGLWAPGPDCPDPLLAELGACCTGSTCVLTPRASCDSGGYLFVGAGTVCNAPGDHTSPCCAADFNQSGQVSVQDIFEFLTAYFLAEPRADTNSSGTISVQDIFDFLASYFAGCP